MKESLQRAGEHIAENKMEKKIEIRLSNGFSALKKGEAESAVIAGMGGGLMIRILTEGEQIAKSLKECILQPPVGDQKGSEGFCWKKAMISGRKYGKG